MGVVYDKINCAKRALHELMSEYIRRGEDANQMDDLYEILYNDINGHAQSIRSKSGKAFENCIETIFNVENIPYRREVSIDADGRIVTGSRGGKVRKLDFVVGDDIQVGAHISDYVVVSCKRSLRERGSQDDSIVSHRPRCYYLLILDKIFHTLEQGYLVSLPELNQESDRVLSFSSWMHKLKDDLKSEGDGRPGAVSAPCDNTVQSLASPCSRTFHGTE